MNTLPRLVIHCSLPLLAAASLLSGTISAGPVVAAPLSHHTVDPAGQVALVIHDSGATDLASAQTITFAQTGSARLRAQDGTTSYLPDATFSAPVRSLALLVQRAGGPTGIRTGGCFHSVSFGHAVWLSLAGQRSGDLTCLASNARSIDRRVARATLRLEQRAVRLTNAQAVVH